MSVSPQTELYAFDLFKVFKVSDNNLLVRNSRTGKFAAARQDVYAILASCLKFKTVQQHAAWLVRNVPELKGHLEELKGMLLESVRNGMLVSASEICDWLSRQNGTNAPGNDDPHEPAVLAIITWERPQALERLLNSILENCSAAFIQEIYVVDDLAEVDKAIETRRHTIESHEENLEQLRRYRQYLISRDRGQGHLFVSDEQTVHTG